MPPNVVLCGRLAHALDLLARCIPPVRTSYGLAAPTDNNTSPFRVSQSHK